MLLNMDALGWEEGRCDLLMVNSVLLLGKPVIAVMESMLSFVLFILFFFFESRDMGLFDFSKCACK